jgi:transcriptional regulator with XRE-family HTH domain
MIKPIAIGRSRAVFSARLKRIRITAGMTQKDLERLSGIPKSRISRYENGHLLPSFNGLRRLAMSLGVPESTLLGEGQDMYAVFAAALRRSGIEFSTTEEAEGEASSAAEFLLGERSRETEARIARP